MDTTERICIVGLGYVGLPLALALARHYAVVFGADSSPTRIAELRRGVDRTGEASAARLAETSLRLAASTEEARECSVFIVTAPTPVDDNRRPNLAFLERATIAVGRALKKGDMAVFESTVCPGTTDDFCAPLLQRESSLRVNADFDIAYSPERIAPNEKGLSDAVKIVAASNPAALRRVAAVYRRIVPAGLHEAPDIKTAEAAKITENIQRDVDIAITNELAMTYSRMGLDSAAVFDAAATKWNFRRFHPGLVGGHCIGTDSYYLLAHAAAAGFPMDVLAAARRANDAVPDFVAAAALRLLAERRGGAAAGASVVMFGYSFKENCADVRNTLAERIRRALLAGGCKVLVCDPVADAEHAKAEYGAVLEADVGAALAAKADMYLFAVAHRQFADIPAAALAGKLVVDVKGQVARADWRF